MSQSCYVLELSVVPGRRRRADVFVYNRLVHIRRCLEQEFVELAPERSASVAALAASGETIALWIVEEGRLVRGVDLRPHIRIRIGRDEPISVSDAARRDDAWREGVASAEGISFDIDWDAIAKITPALRGDPLRPGETIDIYADEEVLAPFDSYLEITDDLAYGYEDLEGGGQPPPGFVDPDPLSPR